MLGECGSSVVCVRGRGRGRLEAAKMWEGAGGLSHLRVRFYELEAAHGR